MKRGLAACAFSLELWEGTVPTTVPPFPLFPINLKRKGGHCVLLPFTFTKSNERMKIPKHLQNFLLHSQTVTCIVHFEASDSINKAH